MNRQDYDGSIRDLVRSGWDSIRILVGGGATGRRIGSLSAYRL